MARILSCCFLLIQIIMFSVILHNHWGSINAPSLFEWFFWDHWESFAIFESFFWLCFVCKNVAEQKLIYLDFKNDPLFWVMITVAILIAPIAWFIRLSLYFYYTIDKGLVNFWNNLFFEDLVMS